MFHQEFCEFVEPLVVHRVYHSTSSDGCNLTLLSTRFAGDGTPLACTCRRVPEMFWTCKGRLHFTIRNGAGASAPQKLCSSNQFRGVCAIKTVTKGKRICFRFHRQAW